MSKLRVGRRVGLPARAVVLGTVLVSLLAAVALLATGGRGQSLLAETGRLSHAPLAQLGLTVREVHLQGASKAAQDEISAAAAIRPGEPILAVDLSAVRRRVEAVGWVEHARVMRLFPDTLVVAVTERPLLAIWQHGGRTVVVTNNGAVSSGVDPARFDKLPLIVGDGANLAARPFLALLEAHPRLWARTSAIVRVDLRRWDLRLLDGGVVSLPADGEAAAMKRLESLDESSRILSLHLARIDIRDPEMVVVRPRGASAPASVAGDGNHG